MNWDRLVTSPPPSTSWVFDPDMVAIAHRTKTQEVHCAAEDVPGGGIEVGPVGLQSVRSQVVTPGLAKLKGAAEGARTAAVVVRTGWLRSFMLDVDKLPRREEELLDVVRWRLKKLLPVPPADLRLSIVRLPEADGRRRLLVMAGIERAIASVEACFSEIGVEVGLVTTRLFALVPRLSGDAPPFLLVQHEEGFLSLLFLIGGVPRLLRTKPLPAGNGDGTAVVREAAMTLGFIRDALGVDDEIGVKLSCERSEIDAVLRGWMNRQDGLAPAPEQARPPCGPTTVVERIGRARLEPALAVVSGEVR